MPFASFGTASTGRTAQTAQKGRNAGFMMPGASTPTADNLTGRTSAARTVGAELDNARTRAEIDAMKHKQSHVDREFGLTSQTHAADLEARRKRGALVDSIASQFLGAGDSVERPTGAGGTAVVPGAPGGPPAAVGGWLDGDPAADAGYARLKEREGLRLRGGINTAKRSLGRRGLSGSSFESPAIAALVGDSNSTLADFDASAAADAVGRARQIEDRDVVRGDRAREFDAGQRNQRMDALLRLLGVSGTAY